MGMIEWGMDDALFLMPSEEIMPRLVIIDGMTQGKSDTLKLVSGVIEVSVV